MIFKCDFCALFKASADQNEMSEVFASLSLDYKKWKFDSQDLLTDFVCAGLTSENRFDQLFSGR